MIPRYLFSLTIAAGMNCGVFFFEQRAMEAKGEKSKDNSSRSGRNDGGPFRRETIHNQHRRSYWHDYQEKGLYMVTMVIEGRQRLFGRLVGTTKGRPGSGSEPHVELSELGRRVLQEEVPKISRFYPMVEVWRVAIMPDHIHLLLRVSAPLPEGKHLGQVVRGFKTGCTRAWWQWQDERALLDGKAPSTTAAAAAAGGSAAGGSAAAAVVAAAAGTAAAGGSAAGAAAAVAAAAGTAVAGGSAAGAAAAVAAAAGTAAAGGSAAGVAVAGTAAAGGSAAGAAAAVAAAAGTAAAGGSAAGSAAAVAAAAGTAAAGAGAAGAAVAVAAAAGTAAAGGSAAAVPEASPSGSSGSPGQKGLRPVLYERGYHDRIINKPGMLENIKRYMAENPLRARIRQECPRLMERQLHLWIGGREYAAFGNLFLLKYPLKEQVFFHRRDKATGLPTETTEAYRKEKARLLRVAEEGTVLVTPGISKGERLVANEAIDARLPLILLQKEPIGKYWKPSQHRFYACAAGYLLILAPWHVDDSSDYAAFHQLNDYACELCTATEMRILDYSALSF